MLFLHFTIYFLNLLPLLLVLKSLKGFAIRKILASQGFRNDLMISNFPVLLQYGTACLAVEDCNLTHDDDSSSFP